MKPENVETRYNKFIGDDLIERENSKVVQDK